MTALPDPMEFVSSAPVTDGATRPNVVDTFWGYEVSPTEHVINIPSLVRGLAGFLAVSATFATLLVWLVPAMSFTGDDVSSKLAASALFGCIAILTAYYAAHGTRVRVQIDTANGELREVVDGPFGQVKVLSLYGFDTVTSVDVVASAVQPVRGQIQIQMKRGGQIALGDGAVLALGPLRARIASDCGLDLGASTREAVWTGPRAA